MSGPTWAAVIVGGAFIAMGVMALLRPAQVLAYFGLHNLTPDLRNEVRAVYGGFGVALPVDCPGQPGDIVLVLALPAPELLTLAVATVLQPPASVTVTL